MAPTRIAVFSLFALTCACGDCGDRQGAFFEPETFGTYEFDPSPDIVAPPLIDFGEVEVGAHAYRDLEIANVGRLPLVIDAISVSDEDFSVSAGTFAENPEIAFLDARAVEVDFIASRAAPVREALHIASNDPDEPLVEVVLLANRLTPCVGSFAVGQPIWQFHDGDGPSCWPTVSSSHGAESEYRFADVPDADDAGWQADSDNHISFERRSSLCGTDCACRGGGDFTYFQTFLYVPENARVGRYVVDIRDVDDGARVTVFNDAYPDGVTDADSYARIPGGSSADLASYLSPGANRIVITHIDDCCSISRIRDVRVTVDGDELEACGG